MNLEDTLSAYDYDLPPHLIAQAPAHPRDTARLLIFNRATQQTSFDTFRNITAYLPANAVLVLNETKVIPARLHLTKGTGGHIEALYLGTEGDVVRVLLKGTVHPGDVLRWEDGHAFTVRAREDKEALLQPSFPMEQWMDLLDRYGETPLPPYIKQSPLTEPERRSEYQTVFARENGSVAAPTAGLHFTQELLRTIEEHGCILRRVTLHVNLGTFAPLTEEHIRSQQLHEEWYHIDADTAAFLQEAKQQGRPILAVGTTVVRTLESAFGAGRGVETFRRNVSTCPPAGPTTLFLHPGNPPRFVDGLITNFHVPKSSLLMLVAAFTGRDTLFELYAKAIEEEMRFFSFGDGMMIL